MPTGVLSGPGLTLAARQPLLTHQHEMKADEDISHICRQREQFRDDGGVRGELWWAQ